MNEPAACRVGTQLAVGAQVLTVGDRGRRQADGETDEAEQRADEVQHETAQRLARPVPPTEPDSGERRGKPRRKSA